MVLKEYPELVGVKEKTLMVIDDLAEKPKTEGD